MDYRDRRPLLAAIGILLLLAGLAAALLGPAEIYCFYLFSPGGRFHYDGFGFGSFMFGNLATQILGYYVVASLCLPLAFGHLRLRRWARTLSLALLWIWLVVGAPLALVFFLVLVTAKDISPWVAGVALLLSAFSYLGLPWLLIRFYRGPHVRRTFERSDPRTYWTDRLPPGRLVVAGLCAFYALVLHVPILFRGLFPLFGSFVSGLDGILLLDGSIAYLALMAWGNLRGRAWAWWGALLYVALLLVSSLWTLLPATYGHILAALRFPPREVEWLAAIPVRGVHLAALVGLPLLLTLAALVRARPGRVATG
jgi:hypothetical protein